MVVSGVAGGVVVSGAGVVGAGAVSVAGGAGVASGAAGVVVSGATVVVVSGESLLLNIAPPPKTRNRITRIAATTAAITREPLPPERTTV